MRSVGGVLAAFGAAAALTACGGSGGDGTSGSTSAASASGGAGAGACAQQVKAAVAKEKQPMEMVMPEASFDMSKNAGKKIWFVSPSQATGYALAISKSVTEAAKAAGMDSTIFDGKAQPDRFTQGLTQAVAQKAGGIIVYGIDPALIPEGLQRAKDAGIPVVIVMSGKPSPDDGTVAETINQDVEAQGRYMADYGAYATGCQVDGAVSFDATYASLVTERDVIKSRLQELCPDTCKVENHDFKLADMATAVGPGTQSVIQRNPDLNVLFPTIDQVATYQIPAVQQGGSDVKIVGTNGLVENLQQILEGSPQIADVAYTPPEFSGWLGVDQVARAMVGEKVGDAGGDPFVMPVQTFDKSNLPSDPSDFGALFPKLADYQSAFKQKWGV